MSTPDQIPNLVAWVDTSEQATITSVDNKVSSIVNKADANAPFTQSDPASQPTTGGLTPSGRNVLMFNGTSEYLSCDSLSGYFTGLDKPFTMFFVGGANDRSQGTMWSFLGPSGDPSAQESFFSEGEATVRRASSTPGDEKSISTRLDSGMFSNVLLFDGKNISAGVNSTVLYRDVDLEVADINLSSFCVGAANGENFFSGSFASLILYNRLLTEDEVVEVQQYIGGHWIPPLA